MVGWEICLFFAKSLLDAIENVERKLQLFSCHSSLDIVEKQKEYQLLWKQWIMDIFQNDMKKDELGVEGIDGDDGMGTAVGIIASGTGGGLPLVNGDYGDTDEDDGLWDETHPNEQNAVTPGMVPLTPGMGAIPTDNGMSLDLSLIHI